MPGLAAAPALHDRGDIDHFSIFVGIFEQLNMRRDNDCRVLQIIKAVFSAYEATDELNEKHSCHPVGRKQSDAQTLDVDAFGNHAHRNHNIGGILRQILMRSCAFGLSL